MSQIPVSPPPSEVIQYCFNLLALDPNQASVHNNLGAALLVTGQLEQALAAFESAIALAPDLAEAHNNRANALAALGRAAEALTGYEQALSLRPGLVSALANMSKVLVNQKRLDEAIGVEQRILALTPDDGLAYVRLGALLVASGRPEAAIDCYETAIRHNPSAQLYNDLGAALAGMERFEDALEQFQKAVALAPGLTDAWCNLASSLSALNRHREAVEIFGGVVKAVPQHALALSGMSVSLEALGSPHEALARAEQARTSEPGLAQAAHAAGQALMTLGRLDEAAQAFRRAIALSPDTPQFYWALGECTGFSEDEPLLQALEALAKEETRFSARERARLNHALANALERVGRLDEAFRRLRAAAAIGRLRTPYNEALALDRLRQIRRRYTFEQMRRVKGGSDMSETPIFIVGMPRSGTTLVEQILASHPRVFGGGELSILPDLVQGECGGATAGGVPDLDGAELLALGARYSSQLQALAPEAARVTDKMPSNFALIGVIRLALPRAKIVHVSRDPVDTCVSCFSKLFAKGQPFANDLGELGRYYRAYAELMAHWRGVLPEDAILEVRYEDLIRDFDVQARRIVSGCGLDWSANCLDFHTTSRAVRTASAAQVRRPIYRGAIGRGRAYAPFLRELYDALGAELTRAAD